MPITLNGTSGITDADGGTVLSTADISTQLEAETGTDNTKVITPVRLRNALNATGDAPVYACRAWVNFNGTGTVSIRGSGNVTSITDNGTGDYTVNFTTALPDANYAIHVTANHPNNTNFSSTAGLYADAGGAITKTTTAVRVGTGASNTTGAADRVDVNVAIFR